MRLKVTTRILRNSLGNIATALPSRVGGRSKASAEAIREDIDSSWSGSSPSAPGSPPAAVTSALRDSLDVEKVAASIWGVTVDAEHGAYLELGTRKMAPRPFLKPAAERQRQKHIDRVAQGVKEAAGA